MLADDFSSFRVGMRSNDDDIVVLGQLLGYSDCENDLNFCNYSQIETLCKY